MKFSAENILKVIREEKKSHLDSLIYELNGNYSNKTDIADLKLEAIRLLAENHIRFSELSTKSKPTVNIIKTIEKELIKIRKDNYQIPSREPFGYVYIHDDVADLTDMHYAIRLSKDVVKDINKQFIWTEERQKEVQDNSRKQGYVVLGGYPDFARVLPKEFNSKMSLDIRDLKKYFMIHGKPDKYEPFELQTADGKKHVNANYLKLVFKILNTNILYVFTNKSENSTIGFSTSQEWCYNGANIAVMSPLIIKS